jgi:hypothetical protein
MQNLRIDSRGLIVSRGDFALVIHKGADNQLLLTSGFYEGEHKNPKPNDFNIMPTNTVLLGEAGTKIKGSFVFRLASMHECAMLGDLIKLAERVVKDYEKIGRIRNPKRLYEKCAEILGREDIASPFDVQSAEFEDNLENPEEWGNIPDIDLDEEE